MAPELLTQLAIILALGIFAQIIAAKLRWPSVLLLLLFGCAAGAGAQWLDMPRLIDPVNLLGDLLQPAVALAVAVILFEGGLSLRLSEMREVGAVVRNLLSVGVLISWILTALAAFFILDYNLELSLLIGAILVVTGPTVIGPILLAVRPAKPVGSILKWEGIVIDPIGAVLAVLVFEVITEGGNGAAATAMTAIWRTVVLGSACGGLAAGVLILALGRYWVPDLLHSPATLAMVALAFTASNHIQHESGLLAVTIMGMVMANQHYVSVRHIVQFKENLRVLLISTLFIVLASRIELQQVQMINWRDAAFVFVLIGIVRPLAVWICTMRSKLSRQQRIFLALIAPRGIVAAAVATVFALELGQDAQQLVPTVFLVIFVTVAFSGLIAAPAARALKLVSANPQGILIVGAHEWARTLADALKQQNIAVSLVDTNIASVRAARNLGLDAHHGNILSEQVIDNIELAPLRRMLALTPNDEANALAAVHCVELFGRAEIYQLAPPGKSDQHTLGHLRGRYLFAPGINWWNLYDRFAAGAVVKTTKLSEQFNYEQFTTQYADAALPLLIIHESGNVTVLTANQPPLPGPGDAIVFLLDHEAATVVQEKRRAQ